MVATQEATIVKNKPTVRRKPLLPHRLADRLELPAELRIPATFEDWIELSVDCDYRVEYRNGHVISIFDSNSKTNETMGQATLTHEQLVLNIGTALNNLFNDYQDIIILGFSPRRLVFEREYGFKSRSAMATHRFLFANIGRAVFESRRFEFDDQISPRAGRRTNDGRVVFSRLRWQFYRRTSRQLV